MKSASGPLYTVYDNPSFAEFTSEYLQKPMCILKIRNAENTVSDLHWIRLNNKYVSLPFSSAVGLAELPAHIPENRLWPFFNAAVDALKPNMTVELQFDDIVSSMRRKDYREAKHSWEVRSFLPVSPFANTDKCLSYLPLKPNVEENFAGFSSNLKRKIRKAGKNRIQLVNGGTELADSFYNVYSANCARLGSPVLKEDFYSGMAASYGDLKSRFFVACHNDKAVGGALLLGYKSLWECIYFGTLKQYNHLYTSYLLVWEMMRFASGTGAGYFSFGRSDKGSGVHQFKKQWGTYDIPLYWNNSHPARFNIRQYKGMTKIWSCIPDFIRQKAGPQIAKRIY